MAKQSEEQTDAAEALDFDDLSPKALWLRFKMVMTEPTRFFDELPMDAGWKDPLVFVGVIAVIRGLFMMFNPKEGLINIPALFASSFISSGVLWFLGKKFFGGSGDYQAMYRAHAYAMAPMIFTWMPLINLLATIYSIFLVKQALVFSQDMEDRNAWIVVGIGVGASVAMIIAVFAYGLITLAAAKSGASVMTGSP